MGLQKFERRLERMVEGTFAKVFRSGLQPVEVGRRLIREMDLRRAVGLHGVMTPNHFVVALSASDYQRFESFGESLRRELADEARQHARKEKYSFMGPVTVELEKDSGLQPGVFLVSAETVESPAGAAVGALVTPEGRRVPLGEEPALIGRLPDCEVPLTDPNASRRHAEVRMRGNEFVIVDLGSTNGTKVNGAGVRERRLADGDEIVIGSTTLRFEAS